MGQHEPPQGGFCFVPRSLRCLGMPAPSIVTELPDNQAEYDIRKYATLRAFLNDDTHKLIGLMGPFGSGKSSAAGVKLVEHGSNLPPWRDGVIRSRYIVVRNTQRELADTTIKTFFHWFPPLRCGEYLETKQIYTLKGQGERGPFDAEFLFRALDRPDHIAHLLSIEFTGGWVNEAREVPWELIRVLFGRAGRYPPKDEVGTFSKLLVLDTNPPDTQSEFYKFFETAKKPKFAAIYKQPSGRGPKAENLDHLQDDYYSDLVQMLSEDEIKVYVDGEYGFIRTGKAVYPAYKDGFHCREFDFPEPDLPIYRGWDFGLTPACVLFQLLPTGQVRIGYEFCAERAGIDAFSDVVLRGCRTEMGARAKYIDIGDPSGESPRDTDERSCFEILQGKGIDIRGGEMSVQIRLESVDLALRTLLDNGEPQLLVHPHCQVLRKGFAGGYQYKRLLVRDSMGEKRYTEEPDKNRFSHPHDALNHALPEIFGDLLRDRSERLGSERTQQEVALSDFDPYEV